MARMIGIDLGSTGCRMAFLDGGVPRMLPHRDGPRPGSAVLLLQGLKQAAENHVGETVDGAVVAVPAGLGSIERRAVKEAARLAGLRVDQLIHASTAAGLAYGHEKAGEAGMVAVYGLGAATFDVTILEMDDGLFQVRATGGSTSLGGRDFDRRIVGWLIEELGRETRIDLSQDRAALGHLETAAEMAKCALGTAPRAEIVLPSSLTDGVGSRPVVAALTRETYEDLTRELVQTTIDRMRQCLADAGLEARQVDEVLLVGRQARSPHVRRAVYELFGKPMKRAADDGVVARGAAIRAGIRESQIEDLCLLDVTPHTLGVETKGGTFTPLVSRNSTIPTRRSLCFTTAGESQGRAEVHVLEGESAKAGCNTSLVRLEMSNISRAPGGGPRIEVCFEVDIDGILTVSATDQATGLGRATIVTPSAEATRRTGVDGGEATDLVVL